MKFCDLKYIDKSKINFKTVSKNKFNVLEVKYIDNEIYCFEFNDKFLIDEIITKRSFGFELRFYFGLQIPHKFKLFDNRCNSLNNFFQYAKLCLNLYSVAGICLGQLFVRPNSNNLISSACIEKNLSKSATFLDVSYLKISVMLLDHCHFYLTMFSFNFVDSMSTHIIHDELLNIDLRFKVNNLKKKKNGVLIFFPSFYVQEKKLNSQTSVDYSVKWPNYTRFSWAEDLSDYCTICVADPFMFSKENEKNSWFIDQKGKSILSLIAVKIRNILEFDNHSFHCGPIINYGSSMGGYAAFLFSCYLKPDLCFAECPQANLTKYKYSLEYLKQYPEIDYKNDQYDCLSFSKIIQKHKPEFKSLFHFYALDRLHLDNFNNEISQLTDEEIKKFNYSLVIENDVENGLSGHQAMPKEKVLKIFYQFLKR